MTFKKLQLVEYTRGIPPPPSYRTVHEPLNSYGSYYAVDLAFFIRLICSLVPNDKISLDRINEQSLHFITINKYSGPLMNKWSVGSENDYNKSYFTITNSLVFDKFTPLNIEACDILRWDAKNIYFYHVKKSFDNSMRDLCSQVLIAAKKVKEDSKNSFVYLETLYDTVITNKGTSAYSIDAKKYLTKTSKKDFIDIVKNRNIIFVLAVLDTSKSGRKLENDIVKYDSNIAKFSLNELSKNMRNLEMDFKILQLEK